MVGLARQLKESTLMMNQSIKNTEKVSLQKQHFVNKLYLSLIGPYYANNVFVIRVQILDSTEEAVEHSLASTGRANTQAVAIYSETSKTSCFTWLVMFLMICIFVMVVLLIKVT